MPYREDLEAALARADALEREVEELRKRNAELERREVEDGQAQQLALDRLREEAAQARRDAVRAAGDAEIARREAWEATRGTALARAPRSAALRRRAGLAASLVLTSTVGVAAAFANHPVAALLAFGGFAIGGIALMRTPDQSGR